jgi:hypothetical protein
LSEQDRLGILDSITAAPSADLLRAPTTFPTRLPTGRPTLSAAPTRSYRPTQRPTVSARPSRTTLPTVQPSAAPAVAIKKAATKAPVASTKRKRRMMRTDIFTEQQAGGPVRGRQR